MSERGADVAREVRAYRRPLEVIAQQAGPGGIFFTTDKGNREKLEYGRWLLEWCDEHGDRRTLTLDDGLFRRDYVVRADDPGLGARAR